VNGDVVAEHVDGSPKESEVQDGLVDAAGPAPSSQHDDEAHVTGMDTSEKAESLAPNDVDRVEEEPFASVDVRATSPPPFDASNQIDISLVQKGARVRVWFTKSMLRIPTARPRFEQGVVSWVGDQELSRTGRANVTLRFRVTYDDGATHEHLLDEDHIELVQKATILVQAPTRTRSGIWSQSLPNKQADDTAGSGREKRKASVGQASSPIAPLTKRTRPR